MSQITFHNLYLPTLRGWSHSLCNCKYWEQLEKNDFVFFPLPDLPACLHLCPFKLLSLSNSGRTVYANLSTKPWIPSPSPAQGLRTQYYPHPLPRQLFLLLILSMEKAMATHSSTLAWKLPWTEEPSGLESMGLLRVGLHFHFSLSCIGEGNGNPLQCSCLENPRDGGA